MKKFLSLLLVLLMAVSLVACGGNDNKQPASDQPQQSDPAPADDNKEPAPAEPAAFSL